jgi:Domain of unknown function (DUF4278)
MKLHFLGASYDCSHYFLDTVESEITGKFHGNTYKIRCPIITRSIAVRNLKYRGVAY